MSAEILRVHPDEPQPDLVDYIVSCLRKGDVIAMPTDTFYGLAVDPVNLHAVEQIYQIKTRQKHKPLSLLIASLSMAYELARDTDPLLDKLADITAEFGGRIYPAKDACMSAAHFQQFYPQWQQFASYIDPAFSSSLWQRVTGLD